MTKGTYDIEFEVDRLIFIVCDDDAASRRHFKAAVIKAMSHQSLFYHIEECPDGKDALKYLRHENSAKGVVLLTGAIMKDVSGWELVHELVKDGLLPLGTVLRTAQSSDSLARHVEKFGVEGKVHFIPKFGDDGLIDFLGPLIAYAADEIGMSYKHAETTSERPTATQTAKAKGYNGQT